MSSRYFYDIEKSSGIKSTTVRCILLGDTGAGKTSVQRGLRAGEPWAARSEEATQQLDILSMQVGKGGDM